MFSTSISTSSLTSSCSTKSLSSFVADVAAVKRIGDLTNAGLAARRARGRAAPQKPTLASSSSCKNLSAFVADVAASDRLLELTSAATVVRRARACPALESKTFTTLPPSKSLKSLKDSIAAAVRLPELQGAATAALRSRSRPIYHEGPARAVPAACQVPEPVRVKYGYACQTMPSRRPPPPCDELEEVEVIVFPTPERPNSTLIRMETMLEDLRANGLNAEVIRRNFRRRDS